VSVWRRVLGLSWPVMAEHVVRTGMRTTDVIVTGLFSPAAVAAVGLADLYARLPLRIGLGLGGGAIALSSQDTGAAAGPDAAGTEEEPADGAARAVANRDEAVTQALALGALAGVPFVAFGLALGERAIAVLGAPPGVAAMGGAYLAIIFATAPARHVAIVGARALQGTGDTRTPMYVNGASNVLNILGSVGLGLGVGPLPRLEVVGVGLATAFGNVFTAAVLLAVVYRGHTHAAFRWSGDLTIARQLLSVSAPRVAEGMVATVVEFPFNALLLGFGTEVNAAYQIGRRMYQQVTSPLSRGYHVGASVVVGQALGDGDPAGARFGGLATAALGVLTVGAIGVVLAAGADRFVLLFTRDPATVEFAAGFARAYGLAAPATVVFVVLAGALQGGSDTRTPFVARTTGLLGFFLGFSWLAGVALGWGVVGVYAGVALFQVWGALVVGYGFARGGWAARATELMAERGSVEGG